MMELLRQCPHCLHLVQAESLCPHCEREHDRQGKMLHRGDSGRRRGAPNLDMIEGNWEEWN